ncbi:baculoviral IAP repeat-containing protein 5-like [Leptopilina heterotoma]|uniref:baculoviral IAP repeat-containing protein 5-like n=1 Tax=Leptopilina heterotoma TaxID=63436 RepID=UPI001CA8B50B|nr:baculoviral IAP repeat-containing protein 5-like [Leptopilina heterotoma]
MDILNNILANAPPTFWKKGRLETFENWPFQLANNNCNAERMAAAGFHFIGNKNEPDLVGCFICSKQLDGWEPDDDPWAEHEKHQSSCAFVKLNKPDEMLWTIEDLYSLLLETLKKDLEKQHNFEINKFNNHVEDLLHQIPNACKGSRKSRKNA